MELSSILNSCNGANREWKAWRKTWQDIRSRTKVENISQKIYLCGTGGGPFVETPQSDFGKEVLNTIKEVYLKGHPNVNESSCALDTKEVHDDELVPEIGLQFSSIQLAEDDFISNASTSGIKNISVGEEKEKSGATYNEKEKRKFPRAPRKKLMHASEASENYRVSLEKKNKIKSDYYDKKLVLLERNTKARERIAYAAEKSAELFVKIAETLESLQELLS